MAGLGNFYRVQLEPGVWLSDDDNDPCRTLKRENAKIFDSRDAADNALATARKFRPFPNACVDTLRATVT